MCCTPTAQTPEHLLGLLSERIWRIGPIFVAFRPAAGPAAAGARRRRWPADG